MRSCKNLVLFSSLLAGLMLALLLAAPAQAVSEGTWAASAGMTVSRALFGAVRLTDGRVLVSGGLTTGTGTTPTAEIYNPATGHWSSANNMITPRSRHTATLLNDGRVLVTGGRLTNFGPSLSAAEIYSPATGLWSATGSMAIARDNFEATLLPDGRVLVSGGVSQNSQGPYVLKSAEIYDPQAGSWSSADQMASARYNHTATLLQNGTVLVAGGAHPATEYVASQRAEIYDPQLNRWKNVDNLNTPRFTHSAQLLPDGRVVVAGGWTGSGLIPTRSAEIYDPVTGRWTETGSMSVARGALLSVLLNDGTVLVAGGRNDTGLLASAERYNPTTGSWNSAGSMTSVRSGQSLIRLIDGRALAAGGSTSPANILASAELYTP